jgi:hypothetical protein
VFVQSFVLTFWLTIGFCALGFGVLMPFSGFGPESQNTVAALMFDMFAVFVQTKMLSALNCNYAADPPLLVATEATQDPLVCWDGLHMLYGAIALVAIPVFNISSVFVKFRIQCRQSVVVYDLWFVAFQQQLLLLAATVRTFFGNECPYVPLATLVLCSLIMLTLALFYRVECASGHRICNVASLTHAFQSCVLGHGMVDIGYGVYFPGAGQPIAVEWVCAVYGVLRRVTGGCYDFVRVQVAKC